MATVAKNMDRQVAKAAITEDQKTAAIGRITAADGVHAMAPCDMIIEAATEKEAIKHAIFASLIPHLRPDAVLATNTSSISITRLGAATDRPGQFIGMHFLPSRAGDEARGNHPAVSRPTMPPTTSPNPSPAAWARPRLWPKISPASWPIASWSR